jgi:hypothetical protein
VQVAKSIDSLSWRAEALSAVAEALAGAGQADRAVQVAQSIADPSRQGRALSVVVTSLLGAGEADRALQVAHAIPEDFWEGEALNAVVASLLDAGQADRALQVAHSIPDDFWEGEALRAIAHATGGGFGRQALESGSLERGEEDVPVQPPIPGAADEPAEASDYSAADSENVIEPLVDKGVTRARRAAARAVIAINDRLGELTEDADVFKVADVNPNASRTSRPGRFRRRPRRALDGHRGVP